MTTTPPGRTDSLEMPRPVNSKPANTTTDDLSIAKSTADSGLDFAMMMDKPYRRHLPMPFTPANDGLLYEERGSTSSLRSLFVTAGVTAIVCSFFFVDLIRQTGVPSTPAKAGGIVASVAGMLGFWWFGGFCLKHGLFTPQQTVFFDSRQQRIVHSGRSPARGLREVHHRFIDVAGVEVGVDFPEDGEPVLKLRVLLSGAQPILLYVDGGRGEAEHWADEVRGVLGLHRRRP
ncbi:MAG TPA: hypothetical protein VGC55_16540 [Dokdonella sp.]